MCGLCHTRLMSEADHFFPRSLAFDSTRLHQLFSADELLPLWIAEPYVPLAAPIRAVIEERANLGWYGYETRPDSVKAAFWKWMADRHGWSGDGLTTIVSPSVGTSIGVLINELTGPGDGVIIQPPVFTDFKPLISSSARTVKRNPLVLTVDGYRMDLDGLAETASNSAVRLMILCNPHNPVGRLWSKPELRAVARICAENDVAVISDEIHADLTHPPHSFTPFAEAAKGTGVTWAATHGPIKTFGLAGICDTLLITDSPDIGDRFKTMSSRLHLTRNNVFATAAFETAYEEGGAWLDTLLDLTTANIERLHEGLTRGHRGYAHPGHVPGMARLPSARPRSSRVGPMACSKGARIESRSLVRQRRSRIRPNVDRCRNHNNRRSHPPPQPQPPRLSNLSKPAHHRHYLRSITSA